MVSFATIINDCADPNAMMRQQIAASTLFKVPAISVPVKNDLEVGGNIIDAIDAAKGQTGIIFANHSRRDGESKGKWHNGSPFAMFIVDEVVVYASIEGYTLSLAKKLSLIEDIRIFDVPTVIGQMVKIRRLTPEDGYRIIRSQFRSLDFLIPLAKWQQEELFIPSEAYALSSIPNLLDPPHGTVWWIDNFGNAKTTLLPENVEYRQGKLVGIIPKGSHFFEALTCYQRLSDVPDGRAGLVIGSSGLGDNRFLEIVVQGGSAQKRFGLSTGGRLLVHPYFDDYLTTNFRFFPIRCQNCFEENGLRTFRDLVQKSEKELLGYFNFGVQSLKDTQWILNGYQLKLGMEL